jgi:integrase
VTKGDHHAALPYVEAPAFMAAVRANDSIAARAVEFVALTAARLNEVREMTWDEIDLDARTWTVPAKRMKAGKEHRVPLSEPALAVLKAMQAIRHSDYVFPSIRDGRPISANALTHAMQAASGNGATIHGLRSTFRDWASERTNFAREVCEAALAHTIPDAVEAAYRRGDLFTKRAQLMLAWAAFCDGSSANGKVVPIKARG